MNHLEVPLVVAASSRSRATIEAENRLSPGPRPDHGSGFAVVNVSTFVAGSTAGVFQTVAPPVCHSLLFVHVPDPTSPGVGTV